MRQAQFPQHSSCASLPVESFDPGNGNGGNGDPPPQGGGLNRAGKIGLFLGTAAAGAWVVSRLGR